VSIVRVSPKTIFSWLSPTELILLARCTAKASLLDCSPDKRVLRSNGHTDVLVECVGADEKILRKEYGVAIEGCLVSHTFNNDPTVLAKYGLRTTQPFTYDFPRADIHRLIAPDVLHQVIKGCFQDHIVVWVEKYIYMKYKPRGDACWSEIDRR
jgi:hypothetical protein